MKRCSRELKISCCPAFGGHYNRFSSDHKEHACLTGLDISGVQDTISEIYCRRLFMADTYEDVKEIIVDLLNVDESKVTLEARFREDLEADSLDLVELIMAFEDKFGGEISDEDVQNISTVGEVVTYIDDHMVS
jgi:acyl carrier protein